MTFLADVRIVNHRTGTLKAYINPSQIQGLVYSEVLRDVGSVALTMRYDAAVWDSYALDDFLIVYANDGQGVLTEQLTYLLRGRTLYYEDTILQMAFTGVALNHLLTRRQVVPTPTDISSAGGYSTKAGDAVTVLSQYADEQLVNPASAFRAIPDLTVSTSGTGENVGARVRYESVFDLFQRLAERGQVDFDIRLGTPPTLELFIGVLGADKTYGANYPFTGATVLKPELGNLINPSISEDRTDEKNLITVLGEGEGSNQFVYNLQGAGVYDSHYNRIETSVTQRRGEDSSASQLEQAVTTASAEINDNRAQQGFTFELPPTSPLQGTLNLGDRVTATWQGLTFDVRLVKRKITLAPNNALTIDTEFSADE